MKGYLLDTNLLIALFWPSHEQHERAVKWFTRHRASGWATCPFTEAGFVRIVSNPAFSRDAVQPREAIQVLCANTAAKDHQFWPAELPFAGAVAFAGVRLIGHQQVTDAYLLGLAIRKGGVLATLDQRIAALTQPKSAEQKALTTVT
ncbi:MAG TPA: TA system VapC family ribonuclease toxin [Dongiaceae bacterium]|nr:TA system VapC family ribonuclease toxin [Dongiaceae bacterium]